MRPARPFFESRAAPESIWVWDPCFKVCTQKNINLEKLYVQIIVQYDHIFSWFNNNNNNSIKNKIAQQQQLQHHKRKWHLTHIFEGGMAWERNFCWGKNKWPEISRQTSQLETSLNAKGAWDPINCRTLVKNSFTHTHTPTHTLTLTSHSYPHSLTLWHLTLKH